jgi:hypothetical protein
MCRIVLVLLPLLGVLVACAPAPSATPATPTTAASPSARQPSASAASSSAAAPLDLPSSGSLSPGVYTRDDFRPPITFELDDGWSVGSVVAGFFDVEQQQGTPDVIAVQFALPGGVVGADGATVQATSAGDAVAAIRENPGLVTIDENESRLGEQTGTVLEVENPGPAHAPIFDVPAGRLGIDADRRRWIALFDTRDGVLAVMVGGSTADWDHALTVAEPVLESIVIDT